MSSLHRGVIIVFALVGCTRGCGDTNALRVANLSGVTSLWSSFVGVCAGSRDGLRCFDSHSELGAAFQAHAIPGVGEVRSVAMQLDRACALDREGLKCFPLNGAVMAVKMPLTGVSDIVAVKDPEQFCALNNSGVVCWASSEAEPKLVRHPEIGKPAAIFLAVDRQTLCSFESGSVACYTFDHDPSGPARRVFMIGPVEDPRMVAVDRLGGEVYVLDRDTLKHGSGRGTLSVGNPFAASTPLAVPAVIQDQGDVLVRLKAVSESKVRAFVGAADRALALDEQGVIDEPSLSVTQSRRWGGANVSALWCEDSYQFFVRIGNALHRVENISHGQLQDDEITGVERPVLVRESYYATCVLDEAGAVSCVARAR